MICNIQDPLTKEDYTRDPRNIARKAVELPEEHRHRRHRYFGPEVEFFIFDDVRFDQNEQRGLLPPRQHRRARGTRGREERPNLGYKLRYKEGYFPVPPTDSCRTSAPR